MTQPKIMVVDDEPIIRMDLREMLENEGYLVVAEAKNGEEAVELAHRHKPDLIIMDVKMPVLNGIKASGIIRSFSDSSILLLTAYSQKELVQDARKAGVSAYLVKPVSEDDLIPAVEIALSQKEKVVALKKDIHTLKQKIEDRKTRGKGKRKAHEQSVSRGRGCLQMAAAGKHATAHAPGKAGGGNPLRGAAYRVQRLINPIA